MKLGLLCREQFVDFGDYLKGVGYVDYVGFAAGPAAVGVEGDGAAVGDEAPADDVRLFAVAAGGEALGVARRCAGLADLVQMREEGKNGVAFAALVDERLAAAERCAGLAQEAEDEVGGFGDVDLAVGLLLGPASAGDEEEFGVGADGLLVLLRRADAGDGGAGCGELDCDFFDCGRAGCAGKGCVGAGVEEQEPGAGVAGENGFDALAIEPAGGFDGVCRR